MDIIRAKEILTALADGVNPVTGEVLPAADSCNQADVIRALHAVLQSIPESKLKPQPRNAGKPWTDEEERILCEEFEEGLSVNAIAKAHGRSPGAIESRLVSLGKMESTYFPRTPRTK